MREELLKGVCEYPGYRLLERYPDKADAIKRFWRALWWAYLNDKGVNGIHWYEQLGGVLLNKLLVPLSELGWIESKAQTGRNWIEITLLDAKLLEHVSKAELTEIKVNYKHEKYILKHKTSTKCSIVSTAVGRVETGLVRVGFMEAGKTEFAFDNNYLAKYQDAITLDANKGMERVLKMHPDVHSETSYDSTVEYVINKYTYSTATYTLGDCINDSRGRAIFECLSEAGNPITSKALRALVVCG